MKKIFSQALITLTITLAHFSFHHAMSSEDHGKKAFEDLPMGQLSPQVLQEFQPKIRELLDKADIHLQDDTRTKRKTLEYGYRFHNMVEKDFSYKIPPQLLIDLGDAVCDALHEPPESFSNYIVSLYEPGFQLEPHADADLSNLQEYGFYFDEKIFGVIIEPDPSGSLYLAHYDGNDFPPPLDLNPRYPLPEKPGTVFVLKGEYRHKPYYHGVSGISKSRITVTFRKAILPQSTPPTNVSHPTTFE
jgi:hypothetical protein